jgi:2-polyprenyl-3-methyl-5-hydroxy-6-metoxy-1,4-benzoquinol methylase
VTGVDIAEKADISLNLDECARLPFADQEFETVICLDVLEHLENLHRVFDEAARVCSKWLLVSLPNSWHLARLRIARGKGKIAHYGLPLSPPEDRHRWFFSYEEALAFFRASEDQGFRIVRVLAAEKKAYLPISWFRHCFWPDLTRYRNRYVHTVFCLFVRLGD